MSSHPIIPLFPLNIVVFPGERQPLHIFEQRYKEMIAHCRQGEAEGEVRPFGISLIAGPNLSAVGCSVEITEVLREYADGRLDILTEGRRRYRTVEVYQDQIYYRAAVEFFDDEEEEVDDALLAAARQRYHQVFETHLGHELPTMRMARSSFEMAQLEGLSLEQKQALLEAVSENRRLQLLCEYLDGYLEMLRQRREKEKEEKSKIKANGHTVGANGRAQGE